MLLCSWNQPVLSNKGNIFYFRKQLETLIQDLIISMFFIMGIFRLLSIADVHRHNELSSINDPIVVIMFPSQVIIKYKQGKPYDARVLDKWTGPLITQK